MRAFAAARAAQAAVAAMASSEHSADAVSFAVALHLGRLMYGNIGGGDRLDFTCIGPAVNLAARLEKIAARLRQPIVASAEFAARLPGAFALLGEFPTAGFTTPQSVFGLAATP
jgi:adenylate cyclase